MSTPLNSSQQNAVDCTGRHCLIIAGPGTGKTHTLVARMVRVVSDPSFMAQGDRTKALAITFTQKAAQEMLNRLRSSSVRLDLVEVGTFHQFCLNLLRRFVEHTPLPTHFKIASPQETAGIVEEIWPHKTARDVNDTLEQIAFIKSTVLALEPTAELTAFQKALRARGLIDMDDILREALLLLDGHQDVLAQVRRDYRHIFVDEYQDTNAVQNALLKILAQDGTQLTAIGDPNQSIYGFRGSDVEIFHRFEDDFPQAKLFMLTENYRSGVTLVTASSQVIGQGSRRGVPRVMAMLGIDGTLMLHEATTDRAEAEYVAHQIENMVGGFDMRSSRQAKFTLGDIAILTRLKAQQPVIIQALDHLNIPYQVAKKAKPGQGDDEQVLGQFEETLDYDIEKVSLLTLHAAKGLEFPVVFMVGCEDRLLPLDFAGMKADLDEERRLFYVGMTRAKQELHMTFAKRRQLFGQALLLEPSPFLADIKEDLKAYEVARRKKQARVDNQLKLF